MAGGLWSIMVPVDVLMLYSKLPHSSALMGLTMLLIVMFRTYAVRVLLLLKYPLMVNTLVS